MIINLTDSDVGNFELAVEEMPCDAVARTRLLWRVERRVFDGYLTAMVATDYDAARDYSDSLVILNDLICGLRPLKVRARP